LPNRHLLSCPNDEDPDKIKVLFKTGHTADTSSPVSPANLPSMDTEAKFDLTELNGIPESIPQKPSILSTMDIDSPVPHDDEIVSSPVQEDPRIHFVNLPRPLSKQDNIQIEPTDGLRGRRKKSGPIPSSDDEFQPRLLRRISTGIKRPVTRVLSNTLSPRNTEQSIQPVQRQATLPYLTFSPTIGRNSVPTSVSLI
jgi:hypothetical protein